MPGPRRHVCADGHVTYATTAPDRCPHCVHGRPCPAPIVRRTTTPATEGAK